MSKRVRRARFRKINKEFLYSLAESVEQNVVPKLKELARRKALGANKARQMLVD
jgi:hypothetical protein